MRIAAVVHYYLPVHRAGAEVMLHGLLQPLVARGHMVEVWATDQDGEFTVDGVTVHGGRPDLVDADVVVSHLKEVPAARVLARRARARLVQVLHSDAPWIARDVARGASLYVANTHWVAGRLRPRMHAPHLVVHPPVWPERHRTVPGDAVTLVNPLPEKGAGLFYELAERLPDAPFLVVEGGYRRHEQIRRNNLSNVTWQSATADMRLDVWARTRVLLMPSEFESYGLVAVEAAASGIPTIATRTEGLLEALGDAGTWAAPGDIDLWEKALRTVLGPGWAAASARARARADSLETQKELSAWVEAVESLS
ncbi:glycosyltransferase family 4 protein [Nocardia sp. NPDC051981]|uniref:glycosyltransferase family 4 protein n=1 Tax=Nocardia sp. NPDC051981 TaxID=3155417 RepID=UPI0034229C80